jgi:hypothetical protein
MISEMSISQLTPRKGASDGATSDATKSVKKSSPMRMDTTIPDKHSALGIRSVLNDARPAADSLDNIPRKYNSGSADVTYGRAFLAGFCGL